MTTLDSCGQLCVPPPTQWLLREWAASERKTTLLRAEEKAGRAAAEPTKLGITHSPPEVRYMVDGLLDTFHAHLGLRV